MSSQVVLPDRKWRQVFRRRLIRWFRVHARNLPWRHTDDPYAIWVSEIMLQQTQVATVEPYYQKFLRRFPTIESLAKAPEQEVLRHWEGLGYYRRARSLRRAAQILHGEFGSEFPRDANVVRQLPGIGRYTAGAILSIAFDQREPILEANTIRLLCRLLAFTGEPRKAEGQRLLWSFAEALLPRSDVGTLNQALMEVGSLVCTPRDPNCDRCPLAPQCQAQAKNLQHEIPQSERPMNYEDVREAAVVVRRRGRFLLRRCKEDERWAGLWDFPRFPIQTRRLPELRRELIQRTQDLTGVEIAPRERLATIKHGVTRYRITLECYDAEYIARNRPYGHGEQKWVFRSKLEDYPLSTSGRKISRLLK